MKESVSTLATLSLLLTVGASASWLAERDLSPVRWPSLLSFLNLLLASLGCFSLEE